MTYLLPFWNTLALMAPWLLLGFALAGIMSALLPTSWIRRHLGRPGLTATIKAALFGIPLPVCSCGVVPLAVSLRERGAGPSAITAFLIATPQTSADSIFLCATIIGPLFALFSPLAALCAALLGGLAMTFLPSQRATAPIVAPPAEKTADPGSWYRRAARFALVDNPRMIGKEMLIGILIAGAIAAFVPEDFFTGILGSGLIAKLVMVLCAVPLYVCSSASVPVAAALILKGASPGTALVFLLAGPATNAATIMALRKMLGSSAVLVYLTAVIGVALGFGTILDLVGTRIWPGEGLHVHIHDPAWWHHLGGVLLLGLLAWAIWPRRKNPASCCDGHGDAAAIPEPGCCSQPHPSSASDRTQPASCCGKNDGSQAVEKAHGASCNCHHDDR